MALGEYFQQIQSLLGHSWILGVCGGFSIALSTLTTQQKGFLVG